MENCDQLMKTVSDASTGARFHTLYLFDQPNRSCWVPSVEALFICLVTSLGAPLLVQEPLITRCHVSTINNGGCNMY
jgi:hypothetical protein